MFIASTTTEYTSLPTIAQGGDDDQQYDATLPLVHISTFNAHVHGSAPACEYGSRCNRPDCPTCQNRKGIAKAHEVLFNVKSKPNLYRLDLTLRESDSSLSDSLDRLESALKALRRTPYWTSHVKGGLYRLQVDYPNGHWHPHFHLIIEADPMERTTLSELWHKITGDSFVSYFCKVRESETDTMAVSRYCLKAPFAKIKHDPALMREFSSATPRRRMYMRFGSWRNTRTRHDWKKQPKPKAAPTPEPVQDAAWDEGAIMPVPTPATAPAATGTSPATSPAAKRDEVRDIDHGSEIDRVVNLVWGEFQRDKLKRMKYGQPSRHNAHGTDVNAPPLHRRGWDGMDGRLAIDARSADHCPQSP